MQGGEDWPPKIEGAERRAILVVAVSGRRLPRQEWFYELERFNPVTQSWDHKGMEFVARSPREAHRWVMEG